MTIWDSLSADSSDEDADSMYTIQIGENGEVTMVDLYEFSAGDIVETESAPGVRRVAQISRVGTHGNIFDQTYYVTFLSGGPTGEWPVRGSRLTKISPLKALAYMGNNTEQET